jgi:hypothetical protein
VSESEKVVDVLTKRYRELFSIRIGTIELVLVKILYEAPQIRKLMTEPAYHTGGEGEK